MPNANISIDFAFFIAVLSSSFHSPSGILKCCNNCVVVVSFGSAPATRTGSINNPKSRAKNSVEIAENCQAKSLNI